MTETCSNVGTRLEWGSLTILNGSLKRFEEATKFDSSGTDAIGTTYTVEYQGYIHILSGENTSTIATTTFIGTAPFQLTHIMDKVWLPRQTLRLYWGGEVILHAQGNISSQENSTGIEDIDNGPRCLAFRVDQMFGKASAQVTISLQCTLLRCPGPLYALNNRWAISERYDSDWLRRYTVSGVVRVGHVDAWTNAIKSMVTPPLLAGFRVESMNFGRSTTGLELTYEIVCQQMFAAPPWPASDWKCSVEESIGFGGGVSSMIFRCSISGYVGVSKRDLFIVAMKTFELRVGNETTERGKRNFLTKQATVVDHLESNRIEVMMNVQRHWNPGEKVSDDPNGADQTRWLGMLWTDLGLLPPMDLQSDPNMTSPRVDDGTACYTDRWLQPDLSQFTDTFPSLFFMRFNQTPCEEISSFNRLEEPPQEPVTPDGDAPRDRPPVSQTDYPGRTSAGDDTPIAEVDETQSADFFLEVKLMNRYMVDHGRVQLPYSFRPSGPTSSTCAIRRVHQPKAVRVIYYEAKRLNQFPSIPPIPDTFVDDNGVQYFLDEEEIIPYPPFLEADGTQYVYTIEMRLTYLMDRPVNRDELMAAGSMPWDISELSENGVRLIELVDPTINDGGE